MAAAEAVAARGTAVLARAASAVATAATAATEATEAAASVAIVDPATVIVDHAAIALPVGRAARTTEHVVPAGSALGNRLYLASAATV